MPHIIMKLNAGRSEAQKQEIAREITKAVMATAKCGEDAVSVQLVDIEPARWTEEVYNVDIAPNMDTLHKKPGYDPA